MINLTDEMVSRLDSALADGYSCLVGTASKDGEPQISPKGSVMAFDRDTLAYLNPARHRLNLTVRGDVMARRVLFEGSRAVGVEVESGGERFVVEGSEIVLCAGGIASPQLLLLSGVGPAGELRDMGIPVMLDLPGVGKNLRDHPMVLMELEPDEGAELASDCPRIQTGLRYTAEGSAARNDMQITLTTYVGEHLGDPIAGSSRRNDRNMHFTIILELAESAGVLSLNSTDPAVGPRLDYRYLEDEWDVRRMRDAYGCAPGSWSTSRCDPWCAGCWRRLPAAWTRTRPWTTGFTRTSPPPSIAAAPARWDRTPTRWRWSTSIAA